MPTQNINPLLFMPSPRDIPDVKKLWHQLPYDKFIVKYKPQHKAYAEVKKFFLNHMEYTHIVLCPDDLEITPTKLEILLNDVKCRGYKIISGYCNLDESMPDYYAIQPLGCDYSKEKPDTSFGSWYMKDKKPILPNTTFLEVGHSGCACCVISRELFNKLSFVGAGDGLGWWDWQISKDCNKLGIPIMVDLRVKLWHRRTEQKPIIGDGYSFLLKK